MKAMVRYASMQMQSEGRNGGQTVMTGTTKGLERFNGDSELCLALRCCGIPRTETVSGLSFFSTVFVHLGLNLVMA